MGDLKIDATSLATCFAGVDEVQRIIVDGVEIWSAVSLPLIYLRTYDSLATIDGSGNVTDIGNITNSSVIQKIILNGVNALICGRYYTTSATGYAYYINISNGATIWSQTSSLNSGVSFDKNGDVIFGVNTFTGNPELGYFTYKVEIKKRTKTGSISTLYKINNTDYFAARIRHLDVTEGNKIYMVMQDAPGGNGGAFGYATTTNSSYSSKVMFLGSGVSEMKTYGEYCYVVMGTKLYKFNGNTELWNYTVNVGDTSSMTINDDYVFYVSGLGTVYQFDHSGNLIESISTITDWNMNQSHIAGIQATPSGKLIAVDFNLSGGGNYIVVDQSDITTVETRYDNVITTTATGSSSSTCISMAGIPPIGQFPSYWE